MNFLAHLYLSGDDSNIRIGNFIGDYVKGRRHEQYSYSIQQGIILHRKIDSFTDSHQLFKQSGSRFKPKFNRYSGVVNDLVYDHLLASSWNKYSSQSLKMFASGVHKLLIQNYFLLPMEVKQFLPFLIKNRRLESYQTLQGLDNALRIMVKHAGIPDHIDFLIEVLQANYELFEQEFAVFMDEVKRMVVHELISIDQLRPISDGL